MAIRFMLLAPQLLGVLSALLLLLAGWWLRERRLDRQRKAVRASYTLSEDIIAASSPGAIAEKLAAALPQVIHATSSRLYLYNRATKCLERVPTSDHPEPMVALVDDPPDGLPNAAVVCFRNRTPLSIPDARRNPLVQVDSTAHLPRSALFMPLLAHQEALGVLQVENDTRVGYFSVDDQAVVQHVANQVAAALKLQDQHAMREQLLRGEKLAATGQLISAVAGELRAPLESISELASSLTRYDGKPAPAGDVRQLAAEAARASEIVSRLISFAQQDAASPRPVDVTALLAGLAQFRQPEWRSLGLRIQNHLGGDRTPVLGVESQIEQVLLTLLVFAEQRALSSPAKTITLKTSLLAGRVLVEVDYSVSATDEVESEPLGNGPSPEDGALGLDVCRGIVLNHGGEIRLRRRMGAFGFEVDLPASEDQAEAAYRAGSIAAAGGVSLTLMLVDTDAAASRQLMTLLGTRGHRVIPVAAEEAVEMAQRIRFDAVMWAVRPGRGGWSDFRERVRSTVNTFVLISDGYNQELAASLEQNGGFLLARPIQESALDRILGEITMRTSAV